MNLTTLSRRHQRGAVLPMLLVLIGAGLAALAYTVDGTRMKSTAAQLKRATDATALAVAQEAARNPDANVAQLAERYIASNLGMDQTLARQQITVRLEPLRTADGDGYRVLATFRAPGELLGISDAVTVSSAAVARYTPLEVALMLPVDLSVSAGEMPTLRELSRNFIDRLFDNSNGSSSYNSGKTTWVSLVPYSQAVSVYDAEDPERIRRWARPRGLVPVELTALFNSGRITSLADNRAPDRRARLLCMFRGLGAGENYFWDQPPAGQFGVYYRHDLPENGSPGAAPISWIGPLPMDGKATGINDTRWMVADRGCPNAALLPLSNDRQRLFGRLDELTPRFNVNYGIALGWAGMALSPAMRGAEGWGLSGLPLDFTTGNRPNLKAIVMLAKISGDWMDTDSYNHELGRGPNNDGLEFSRQRFLDLCNEYRQRRLRFHFIGVRAGTAEDNSGSNFDRQATPGLLVCAGDRGTMHFVDGADLRQVRGSIAGQLNRIADSLKREASFIRLIE